MLGAISAAQRTIDFLNFVYWRGDIAREFAHALTERARSGVRVRVLIDAIGGRLIDNSLIKHMRAGGVAVEWFRRPCRCSIGCAATDFPTNRPRFSGWRSSYHATTKPAADFGAQVELLKGAPKMSTAGRGVGLAHRGVGQPSGPTCLAPHALRGGPFGLPRPRRSPAEHAQDQD